jgi:hypothetical protein
MESAIHCIPHRGFILDRIERKTYFLSVVNRFLLEVEKEVKPKSFGAEIKNDSVAISFHGTF